MRTLSRIVVLNSFIVLGALSLGAADAVNRAKPAGVEALGGASGASEPLALFLIGSGFIFVGMIRRAQRR